MLLLIADVYIRVKFIPDKKQKKAPTYSIAEEWKKAGYELPEYDLDIIQANTKKKPTWIHLISRDDYLAATAAAITQENIQGTYNLGDEGKQTLQEYLDFACQQWLAPRPWRMPDAMIYGAASVFEGFFIKKFFIP